MFSSHEQMHTFGIPQPMSTADRQYRPNVEIAPNCPRCDSPNTKFCYYNNYSLTQPRYFCKGCRRYWTKGGSLRNVPVGGGCSKNRRGRSSVRLSRRTAEGRKSSSSGALRPDLALDDMVGGAHHRWSTVEPSGGEGIDLGMLYLKFLNPCPVPELAEPVGPTSSDMDAAMAIGEMSYALGGRGFESVLTMPAEEETAGMEWQAAEMQQELCPFPEVHMAGCDWSSLDHSSFGPF